MNARQRVATFLAVAAVFIALTALPVEWFAGLALGGSTFAFAVIAAYWHEVAVRTEGVVFELGADRDQWSRRALRAEAALGKGVTAVPLLPSTFAADVDQSLAIARHASNADARLASVHPLPQVPQPRDGSAS